MKSAWTTKPYFLCKLHRLLYIVSQSERGGGITFPNLSKSVGPICVHMIVHTWVTMSSHNGVHLAFLTHIAGFYIHWGVEMSCQVCGKFPAQPYLRRWTKSLKNSGIAWSHNKSQSLRGLLPWWSTIDLNINTKWKLLQKSIGITFFFFWLGWPRG